MVPYREIDGEERWHTMELVEGLLLFLVVHTIWDENDQEMARIISAREVTAHLRPLYEDVA